MNRPDDARLNAGAYALNALDDAERTIYEELIAQSDYARLEAEELMITATHLASLVPTATPSPRVKRELLTNLANATRNHGEPDEKPVGSLDNTDTNPIPTVNLNRAASEPDTITGTPGALV